jgi:prolyl oligopeptidase
MAIGVRWRGELRFARMLTRADYPETRIVNVTDEFAGVKAPDPYRWLEDDSEEVRHWQTEQAELASSYVREWPHLEAFRNLVARYSTGIFGSVPRFAGGSWFRDHTPEDGSYPQVIVADEPFGEGRVLVDLAEYKIGEDMPFLSWLSPSPDSRVLAIGVCTDGSEQNTIRLIDVASGQPIAGAPAQVLYDASTGGVVWLPDSSGFYFLGLLGSVHDFDQGIFVHRLGEPPPTKPEHLPWIEGAHDWTVIQISADGRWAVAAHRILDPIPIAIRDLTEPSSTWRPFVTDISGTVAGYVVGDNYVAITDVDAPRGRLVAIPLDAADPNDTSAWLELIPASDAVLRRVTTVGDHLYVSEFADTYSKVRIVDATGVPVGIVPLPAQAAIAEDAFYPLWALPPRGHPDEFVFACSTLASSWAVYRHRPGAEGLELLKPPELTLDAVISDHWATSADGTRIPYHTVRPRSAPSTGPLPALIWAYGGFNWPLVPQYPHAGMAAFVAAGGVYVHAHLRGGAEYGRQWWEAGRMKNKQNGYADLYAVAEDLVANDITTREQLALVGESNGGLLCGVAITQRPELWKAVVPRVPILDLLGALREPYGTIAIAWDLADINDPAEIERMLGFSPYHLVKEGTVYPSTFIDAGNTDPRCPPWHARKLAARLQAARPNGAPVLLHVWDNVGHGFATEASIALEQNTEWLAFVLKTLGMTL